MKIFLTLILLLISSCAMFRGPYISVDFEKQGDDKIVQKIFLNDPDLRDPIVYSTEIEFTPKKRSANFVKQIDPANHLIVVTSIHENVADYEIRYSIKWNYNQEMIQLDDSSDLEK